MSGSEQKSDTTASRPASPGDRVAEPIYFPLHDAAKIGDTVSVSSLLKSAEKERINEKNEGMTALHWAVFRSHYDVTKSLLEHGADVNAGNKDGFTALHMLALMERDEKMPPMDTIERIARLLIRYNADPLVPTNKFKTYPIHYACEILSSKIVMMILRFKSQGQLLAKDSGGSLPIHYAAAAGNTDIVATLLLYPEVKKRINEKNATGMTALHCAVRRGHLEATERLLKHGADVHVGNKDG